MSLKASIVCLSTSRVSLGSLGQLRASTQSSRSCVATVIWVAWLAQVGPSWNPVKSDGGQPPMTRAAVKHPPGYAVIPDRPDTTVNVSAGLHRTVTSLPRREEPVDVVGVAVGPIVISDGRCSSSCLLSSAPHSSTSTWWPRFPTARASTSLTRIGASSARSRATTTSAGNMVAAEFYLWQAWWSARAGRKGRHKLCSSQPHKPPTNHPAHPLMQKFFRCAGQITPPCGARYPSWGEARRKRRQVRTKST